MVVQNTYLNFYFMCAAPKIKVNGIREREIDLILDVRTDAELSLLGFYPGSVHMQSEDLENQMSQRYPDKRIRILAYCNSGQRARAATDKLHALGYVNARYIAGTYQSLL
jgi:rhodanese-related sulfurtransferase